MATPAQAAAATVGAGSLAAAGSYGITQAVKGSGEESTTEEAKEAASDEKVPEVEKEPESKKLTETTSQTYSEHTLGHNATNKPLLIDYKNTFNEAWWKWVYKNRLQVEKEKSQPRLNPLFSGVNKEYDAVTEGDQTNKTSLNYACHKAYGLKWYDFTSENHLLENVKLFCSVSAQSKSIDEPVEQTLSDPIFLKDVASVDTTYANKLAIKGSNKNNLVAPLGKDSNKNEEWWKWSYKKHFLDKKAKQNQIDNHFSKVTSAYSEQAVSPDTSLQTALNQACDSVYKRAEKVEDTTFQSNIKEFCGKSGSSTSITFTW